MTALAFRFPIEEPPRLVRAVLRLAKKKEANKSDKAESEVLEELLKDSLNRIERAPTPSTELVEPEAEQEIRAELALLRVRMDLIQEAQDATTEALAGDVLQEVVEAALNAGIERLSARRAYLAWVIDESDDRDLGREITLPEPTVAPGPSSPSFQW